MQTSIRTLCTNRHCVCIAVLLLVSSPVLMSAQGNIHRKLTLEEASKLAEMALDPKARKLPGLDVQNSPNSNFPDFFSFTVTWGTARSDAGGTVEQIAVDAITGDVWSAVVCRETTSSSLRKLQSHIRKLIGLSSQEYEKLKR